MDTKKYLYIFCVVQRSSSKTFRRYFWTVNVFQLTENRIENEEKRKYDSFFDPVIRLGVIFPAADKFGNGFAELVSIANEFSLH